jgi:hypothetical protein
MTRPPGVLDSVREVQLRLMQKDFGGVPLGLTLPAGVCATKSLSLWGMWDIVVH